MSHTQEPVRYSIFWPFVILVSGTILLYGYQLYMVIGERNSLNAQFQASLPQIQAAADARNKFVTFAKDLVDTAATDPYAAEIVKEANLRIQTNAAPAGTTAPTPSK